MSKLGRILLLGAVSIGIVLALTAAPSAGGVFGQTGYGDDVLKDCPPGQEVGPNGEPCLQSLEVEVAAPAGSTGGDGTETWNYAVIGGIVVLIGGGGVFLLTHAEFLARFRR